jgi:beta-galactosidase
MYRAEWTRHTTLHLFPHWNWQQGDVVDMWAYYNNADEVELFVNGRSMGCSKKTSERLHAIWEGVPFEVGVIEAVSYKGGKEVARHKRVTAGEPARVTLTADRTRLSADGYDLAFITIDCVDRDGNFVPTAMNQLYFEVVGAGELAGVDNGNAAGMESLKGSSMKLFNGKALAIVRTLRGVKGAITLKVTGEGVESAEITLSAK